MKKQLNDKKLRKIYFDPGHPGGFSSAYKLYKFAKREIPALKYNDVKNWLAKQESYTLHRQIRHNFPRRKTITSGIDQQWQADLAILDSLNKYNDGFRHLLTVIDIFSRFAFAYPLKSKKSSEVIKAFKVIFSKRKPVYLQTDQGGEFYNKEFLKFMDDNNVKLFSTFSDTKASIVERWNRTLKDKMFRYFTKNNTLRYIDVLDEMVSAYNRSVHRMIGMKPIDVSKANEAALWNKQYKPHIKGRKNFNFKFRVGDKVRLTKLKRIFRKGYLPKWSDEYFTVIDRLATNPPVYKVADLNNEALKGVLYEPEMQKIQVAEEDSFKIDILKKRKRKNKTQYFVHYRGWPDSFNEWIDSSQLSTL